MLAAISLPKRFVFGGKVRNIKTTVFSPQKVDTMEKANLILILTPHIVRDRNDLRVIFERKMQERQEFLDHYFVFRDQPDYEPPHDYSRSSGLLEDIRQEYFSVDERMRLEALAKPKSPRAHSPGQPVGSETPGAAAPELPERGAPHPSPNLDIAPPPRHIDRGKR